MVIMCARKRRRNRADVDDQAFLEGVTQAAEEQSGFAVEPADQYSQEDEDKLQSFDPEHSWTSQVQRDELRGVIDDAVQAAVRQVRLLCDCDVIAR